MVLTLDARYHPNNISVVSLVKLVDSADSIKCVVLTATSLLKELIPVDPAGGHRYWNTIKTCESRDIMVSADRSVTRG